MKIVYIMMAIGLSNWTLASGLDIGLVAKAIRVQYDDEVENAKRALEQRIGLASVGIIGLTQLKTKIGGGVLEIRGLSKEISYRQGIFKANIRDDEIGIGFKISY